MIKKLVLITCVATILLAQSAQDFKTQQMQEFNKEKKQFGIYKETQTQEFEAYQKAQNKVYKDYKKELGIFWDEPKISTKTEWVSYTQDKKTRTDVDFSKETITIETIASSAQDAKQKLQIALAKVVTIDTKSVQETDPLEKKIALIKKPDSVVIGDVKAEPILSTIIFEKEPTKSSVKDYINASRQEQIAKEQETGTATGMPAFKAPEMQARSQEGQPTLSDIGQYFTNVNPEQIAGSTTGGFDPSVLAGQPTIKDMLSSTPPPATNPYQIMEGGSPMDALSPIKDSVIKSANKAGTAVKEVITSAPDAIKGALSNFANNEIALQFQALRLDTQKPKICFQAPTN